MDEKFVSAEVIGEVVGVDEATVRKWARDRLIPFVRVNSRILRFRVSDVVTALEKASEAQIAGATVANAVPA